MRMEIALTVFLAAVIAASAISETNALTRLGDNASNVELILTMSSETSPTNSTIHALVRNVSRDILNWREVSESISGSQLTWETPAGIHSVPLGMWRGLVPDLKPAETCAMQSKPDLHNAKLFPLEGNGIYFLYWRLGSNRSNTLCFLVKDRGLERLPTAYTERKF